LYQIEKKYQEYVAKKNDTTEPASETTPDASSQDTSSTDVVPVQVVPKSEPAVGSDASAQTTAAISLRKKSFCTSECLSVCKDSYQLEKEFISCSKSACLCKNVEEILINFNSSAQKEESSSFRFITFIFVALVAFSVIVIVTESIRNRKKSEWITTEVKKNPEYELLTDVKETPLITEL